MTAETKDVKDVSALLGELRSDAAAQGAAPVLDHSKAGAGLENPAPVQTPTRVFDAQSVDHFNALLKGARGAVLVDFTQEGCEACEGELPILEKLAGSCDDVTVIHVDSTKLPDIADKFKVEGTPTLLYAKSGKAMTPRKAEEVEPDDELRRKLKCSR